MKAKILIVGVVGLGLLSSLAFLLIGNKTQVVKQEPNSSHFHTAIPPRILDALGGREATITMIIPGQRVGDEQWRFTGSLKEGRFDKPFYGVIFARCLNYDEISCWRLTELTVNGKPVMLAEGQENNVAQEGDILISDENPSQSKADTEAEPPVNGAVSVPVDVIVPALDQGAAKVAAVTFWKTKSDNVNTRSGPGTNFPKGFVMPSYVKLTLVREEQGWGLFSYTAKGGGQGQVWIIKNFVIPYE